VTTVCYKAEIMASDSRCTDEGIFATRTQKIWRLENRALLGGSGDADMRDVVALLGKCSPKRLPSRAELASTQTDFAGLLVFANGSIWFVDIGPIELGSMTQWTASLIECKERFAATGSGQQFALGAMAAGRSAKEAVEIAIRYDTASGPPVVEVPLKEPPKRVRPK
jgi:hypothetical protein